jgi:23S rRNA (cytidine1920-2'-O)/16S rRNA (cytidine1409-2'-O)-methyltransferase
MGSQKKRLDRLLIEKKLVHSRSRAHALIMAGKVRVNQVPIDKPGALVLENAVIELQGEDHPYVSRGGLKLKAGLEAFDLRIEGYVCMDVGASTGGFTDCLLQHGAQRVYALDVGYGQLAWKLRQDARVVVIERTNIRYLPAGKIPELMDLATIDVSFISLKIVVPATLKFLKPKAAILALIKPQFEVGRGKVGKGGIVRSSSLHEEVIAELSIFFRDIGLYCGPVIPSPILGPKGNQEFVMLLQREGQN